MARLADERRWPRTELLILQPTPFCNIDCRYCYLPSRNDRARMSAEVLAAVFSIIPSSPLVSGQLTVVWHAGEPLVLPPAWYDEAFAIARRYCPPNVTLHHTFQSNGTLLTPEWVAFLRRADVKLSLSIDGPAWLHDRNRVTRTGKATHERSMRGLRLLQGAGLSPAVLTVLTASALDHADALFEFYRDAKIDDVAFNVEELEAANTTTSLSDDGTERSYRGFMSRFIECMHDQPGTLTLRELTNATQTIRFDGIPDGANQEAEPMRILSVTADGSISTFSPEFLGTHHALYGDYTFGNILSDDLASVVRRVLASPLHADIRAGIANCRRTCAWFAWCGGGTPSNKVYETGSAQATETSYCRLTRQALFDVVLTSLEKTAGIAA